MRVIRKVVTNFSNLPEAERSAMQVSRVSLDLIKDRMVFSASDCSSSEDLSNSQRSSSSRSSWFGGSPRRFSGLRGILVDRSDMEFAPFSSPRGRNKKKKYVRFNEPLESDDESDEDEP